MSRSRSKSTLASTQPNNAFCTVSTMAECTNYGSATAMAKFQATASRTVQHLYFVPRSCGPRSKWICMMAWRSRGKLACNGSGKKQKAQWKWQKEKAGSSLAHNGKALAFPLRINGHENAGSMQMRLGFRKGNVAGALSLCPSVSGRLDRAGIGLGLSLGART